MKTLQNEIAAACDWTRARLPLLAGAGREAAPESTAQGGDLSRADRRRARAHLDACGACRARWSALVRSSAALSAAAAESPVEPYGPSLWEGIAARIGAAESARPSVWTRARRAVLPDRLVRRIDRGLSGLPLQRAWLQDTIAHDLPDRLRARFEREARASARFAERLVGAWSSPVGLGATAALGAFLAALSALHHAQADADARVAAASAPAPARLQAVPLVVTPARPRIEAPPVAAPSEPPAAEPEALARNTAPLQPPPPSTPAARPASAAPTYDYDLERGVPMPPDARIARPAY